jgi:hypothetical protein
MIRFSKRWLDQLTEANAFGVQQQKQAQAKLAGAETGGCDGERDKNLILQNSQKVSERYSFRF